MTVANDQRYTAVEGVVARAVGDEMVLLDLNSGSYFTLNAVGSLVWQRVGLGETLDVIVAAIVADFDVEPEAARADALAFLHASMDAGLIAVS